MMIKGMMATLIIAVAASLGVSAAFFPLSRQVIDPTRGAETFSAKCGGCHSLEQSGPALRGPSLYGVGEWAGKRVEGLNAEQYIFQSIVEPNAYRKPGIVGAMPKRFAEELSYEELINVTAFLASGNHRPRYSELVELEPPERSGRPGLRPSVDLVEIERGRQLFREQCNTCHDLEVRQNYDLYYPNLSDIGVHGQSYLREALLEPSKTILPGYETWLVQTTDGETVSGRLIEETEDGVSLIVVHGRGFAVRRFSNDALKPFADGSLLLESPVSDMPPLASVLSQSDLTSLLSFLRFLRT